ncbi:hypothetical protein M404DRAFT_1006895 [Pisolithus tinctorius Marx 270]|uniref:Extracellular membrane protein CFEM domain-containing protein n=1 Tax=Pisolithus tinctorius Marx 270 TaxID=870435 RepID=A0A0C3IGV7_PISTI|nr:hypothetical protein M404DRAFT_1006895 [Pisolithus tinctorius Marx 270]
MLNITPLVSLFALAGQAYALTIDVGGFVGDVSAADFLNVPDSSLLATCQSPCSNATTQIQNCGPDDMCLCGPGTVTAITSCQQCMFDDLVDRFAESTDPRAGSASALTAYSTACSAAVNVTIPSQFITLHLPPNWDGPYGVGLSLPVTVLVVAAGALLGGSAVLLLSNM